MPNSVSDFFNIPKEVFETTGAFDAILDVDSRLFIDPHLVKSSGIPELQGADEAFRTRFRRIMKLLQRCESVGDPAWTAAEGLFVFPELEGLCIGYSKGGTNGSGMGPRLRRQILTTARFIVDAGIDDPEFFELIGLFEDKVGPDRISDMTGRIIGHHLLRFSQRVFGDLDVTTDRIDFSGEPYKTAVNPYNGKPIILVPKDILLDLPIANSWEDIDIVCAHNEALRERLNQIIGYTWKEAIKLKKHEIKRALLRHPEAVVDLIQQYRVKPARRYDYDSDPSGEIVWYSAAREYSCTYPLTVTLPTEPGIDDIYCVAQSIVEKFKQLVEHNGLNKLLYDDRNKKPKRESAAQLLFFGIASAYCGANNIDLTPEADSGRGPVDFKLSRGFRGKVLVEAKLTTNKNLVHGFTHQLPEYESAEMPYRSIYLVIQVTGGHMKLLEKLIALRQQFDLKGTKCPELLIVDGQLKKSASKV